MVAALKPGRPLRAEEHLGLVRQVVKRYRWAVGPGLGEDDLWQAGAMGVMRAVETFDPSRGFAFSTYASQWIRHFVQRAIENQRRVVRVPVHRQTSARRIGEPIPAVALSLDAPIHQDADAGCWLDQLTAEPEPGDEPAERIATEQRRAALTRALAQLPERSRWVLLARYCDDMTLKEISEPLGLSRERVRQLVLIALEQLRDALASQGVRSLQQL